MTGRDDSKTSETTDVALSSKGVEGSRLLGGKIASAAVSRRQVFGLGAGLMATGVLAACSSGSSSDKTTGTAAGSAGSTAAASASKTVAAGRKVTLSMFVNSGGHLGDSGIAFADEYMANHKNVEIKIVQNVGTTFFPQQLAAFKADPNKPIVNVGWYNATLAGQGDVNKMWSKLDYSAMSNAKDIDPSYLRPDQYGIGISTDLVGLSYNLAAYPKPPTSWNDLWADKCKGKVVQTDYWWFVVYAAAFMHGGDVNHMDVGWQWYQEHAKWILSIATGANQLNQQMANGQAIMSGYLAGNSLSYKYAQKAPIGFAPPEEGMLANPWYLIPSAGNSDDQNEVAQDMINELIGTKWCGTWSDQTLTLPANTAVKLSERLASEPAFAPAAAKNVKNFDWAFIGAQQTQWRANWDKYVKANI